MIRSHAPIVLVAEPDAGLRGSAAETLRGAGMEVIEAADAEHLRELWAIHGDELDAAVIDTGISPDGGRALVQSLHADRPDLPLLSLCAPGEEPLVADREALTAFMPGRSAPRRCASAWRGCSPSAKLGDRDQQPADFAQVGGASGRSACRSPLLRGLR